MVILKIIKLIKEHFIVWMQMESFPSFQKLWGRINNDLEEGKYHLEIQNSMYCYE